MLHAAAPKMTLPGSQPFVDSLENVSALSSSVKTVKAPNISGFRLMRYLMDSWFGALLGGAAYGAWAVWANWAQGANMALTIGAAHWMTSALLTFFGTMAMRRFYGDADSRTGGLRAFAGGLALTYASLFAVHGLLGTQQLLLTLAPGIVPNVLFCASYALVLKRTMKAAIP